MQVAFTYTRMENVLVGITGSSRPDTQLHSCQVLGGHVLPEVKATVRDDCDPFHDREGADYVQCHKTYGTCDDGSLVVLPISCVLRVLSQSLVYFAGATAGETTGPVESVEQQLNKKQIGGSRYSSGCECGWLQWSETALRVCF